MLAEKIAELEPQLKKVKAAYAQISQAYEKYKKTSHTNEELGEDGSALSKKEKEKLSDFLEDLSLLRRAKDQGQHDLNLYKSLLRMEQNCELKWAELYPLGESIIQHSIQYKKKDKERVLTKLRFLKKDVEKVLSLQTNKIATDGGVLVQDIDQLIVNIEYVLTDESHVKIVLVEQYVSENYAKLKHCFDQLKVLYESFDGTKKNYTEDDLKKVAEAYKKIKELRTKLLTIGSGDSFPKEFKGKLTKNELTEIFESSAVVNTKMKLVEKIWRYLRKHKISSEIKRLSAILNGRRLPFKAPKGDSMQKEFFIKNGQPNFDKEMLVKNIPNSKFSGANEPKLNEAIEQLYKGKKGLSEEEFDRAIAVVAKYRGLAPKDAKYQYDKAMELREKAKNNGYADELDLKEHPNFAGSTTQLRFGKIIGDYFGLDPVFGSMVSPTGGIVGPGNGAIGVTAAYPAHESENAVVIHGTLHDAAGLLKNVFKAGPGYDYIGTESAYAADPTSPLTGQNAGINFWNKTLGQDNKIVHLANQHETTTDLNPANDNRIYEQYKDADAKVLKALSTVQKIGIMRTLLKGYTREKERDLVVKVINNMSAAEKKKACHLYNKEFHGKVSSQFIKKDIEEALEYEKYCKVE